MLAYHCLYCWSSLMLVNLNSQVLKWNLAVHHHVCFEVVMQWMHSLALYIMYGVRILVKQCPLLYVVCIISGSPQILFMLLSLALISEGELYDTIIDIVTWISIGCNRITNHNPLCIKSSFTTVYDKQETWMSQSRANGNYTGRTQKKCCHDLQFCCTVHIYFSVLILIYIIMLSSTLYSPQSFGSCTLFAKNFDILAKLFDKITSDYLLC